MPLQPTDLPRRCEPVFPKLPWDDSGRSTHKQWSWTPPTPDSTCRDHLQCTRASCARGWNCERKRGTHQPLCGPGLHDILVHCTAPSPCCTQRAAAAPGRSGWCGKQASHEGLWSSGPYRDLPVDQDQLMPPHSCTWFLVTSHQKAWDVFFHMIPHRCQPAKSRQAGPRLKQPF